MRRKFYSRLPQQQLPRLEPNFSCFFLMPEQGWDNSFQGCVQPSGRMAFKDNSFQDFGVSETPQLKPSHENEHQGWFYGLPRHRQSLYPAPISTTILTVEKQNLVGPATDQNRFLIFDHVHTSVHTSSPYAAPTLLKEPNVDGNSGQKRFLIFDQSGSRTSVIYSSLGGSPVQQPSLGHSNLFNCGVNVEEAQIISPVNQAEAVISDGFAFNHETDEKSEMHEDTDELNALLYSDDDYDSDNEEVSTGHSPGEMTEYEEEVASSGGGPTKRRRELDQEENDFLDTASSRGLITTPQSPKSGSEAESVCGKVHAPAFSGQEASLCSENKRVKRAKIRETVSILRNIIPDGMDKDAMLVLDEAIQYVKSLRLKAMSLGGGNIL